MRGTAAELAALEGQLLRSVRRRGKFLVFQLERDRIVMNLMLTGRLGLAAPGAKAFPQTAFVMSLRRACAAATRRRAWTRGAAWLPPTTHRVELRYRDATRMGKVYLVPARRRPARSRAGTSMGPDADDPALDLEAWRERIRRHRGELKNLLKDQAFVAGIGNGYCRRDPVGGPAGTVPQALDPCRRRGRRAVRGDPERVPPWAIDELRRRVPPRFEVEVRDFLRVHRKGGTPCPRCGTTISEISPGGFVTSWCRTCQR